MGDHAYEGYLAHQRTTHPDERPLDVGEFWAERYREQDANPGSRCC
jgi:uncharacterized short protein YbdD (DUF466 family)